MSQSEFKKRLKVLMNKQENQVCSDCPERQPRWASLIVPPPGSPPGALPIGAFCCLECSGSHRRLGVHISFVRSITLDSWKEKEVLAMENGGNQKVNAIFEANINVSKPTASASGPVRERFIRDKYERRKYYNAAVLQNYQGNESSSEDESDDDVPKKSVVRAPSEAARLRALARKQRGKTSSTQSSPSKVSKAVKKRTTAAAPPAPAANIDLLDFGLPPSIADPGPPPNPPSASPSPTLDMFKNMNFNHNTGAIDHTSNSNNNQISSAPPPPNNSQNGGKPKISSDDILAMFNTAPAPTNNMGFHPYAANNNGMMNNNGMGANQSNNMGGMNNMNANLMMMNQQMQSNLYSGVNNNNMNNNNMNPRNGTMNSSNMMQTQQNSNSNFNLFQGMQNNNNNNMMQNSMPMGAHTRNIASTSNDIGNMMMQQNQQQDFGMNSFAPMGGTPSNLTVMGGNNWNSCNSKEENEFGDFMGGTGSEGGVAGAGNPQMNQFASFGSFR
mmetsp:Transcript_21908/g.24933  ORF Transcript_21908/g.24933 Transcript_21908/m.24933 type:complete len:500 (-) Transcript_21908:215-1714(-)